MKTAAKNMYFYSRYQQGFTLLEMMVVVGIMAALGGLLITTYGSSGQSSVRAQTKIKAARVEMEQIRKSLLQYKRDNIVFPAQSSPADFDFLFSGTNTWNIDYQTGWRGPYITGGDTGLVDIGDTLALDGSGDPNVQTFVPDTNPPAGNAKKLQRGIPDPFTTTAATYNLLSYPACFEAQNQSPIENEQCLLDWRHLGASNSDAPRSEFGRPYLLFDLNDTKKARIVSMGINGKYNSSALPGETSCATDFSSTDNNDDLILCLY